MPSWSDVRQQAQAAPNQADRNLQICLEKISEIRTPKTVIFYASSFLQKPAPASVAGSLINREDVNGFMNALHGAETSGGLTLILHTPGGDPNAVESIVEYLHSKFSYIEVIVPYLAMSGGAMMSLASDLLVMGRQSQLGPIDPQFSVANRTHSARAILDAFVNAKEHINRDTKMAHLWAPILQNMGPSLIVEAEKALSYSKELVVNWLSKRNLLVGESVEKIEEIAAYFNAEQSAVEPIHVHGQRIGMQKIREFGMNVFPLEANKEFQEEVLTAYHWMTTIFEMTPSLKFIASNNGKMWVKQEPVRQVVVPTPTPAPANRRR